MLSIIIPYHNEGEDLIQTTISQIWETIDVFPYEIIVVDDCSDIPLELKGVKVIRQTENKGVGAAFDTGVALCKYENLILMGCDIRFQNNGWASKMLKEIEQNQNSFICTKVIGLNQYSRCCKEDILPDGTCSACHQPAIDNMDIDYRRDIQRYTGATILVFHDHESNPRLDESARLILDAKWLPCSEIKESYEIPCILGAFYGVTKSWYEHVDGWAGHKKWGTLEPLISLKSWLFGGSCRIAPEIEVGHIFKKAGNHNVPLSTIVYNKLLTATLLFEDFDRLINFLGDNEIIRGAKLIYEKELPWILKKRIEYKKKTFVRMDDLLKRFSIDYRKETEGITPDFIRNEANGIYAKEDNNYARHYSQSPYLKTWKQAATHITIDDKVCDIGCGPGQMMEFLLDRGVKSYSGFDISPVAISKACERLSKRTDQHKVSLSCTNVLNGTVLPDADKYVLIEILEHITNDLDLLRKIPSGKDVILSVPNYLGGSHVRKFDDPDQVRERFSEVVAPEDITEIPYGTGKIFVLKGKRK